MSNSDVQPPANGFTTRLAPSPTGRMHAGNIFAALVAWVLSRRSGGRVLLRIDDLDTGRCRRDYADACMRDFELLGITWDGEPLWQSEREAAYARAFGAIGAREHVYPCFCTRADVRASSAPHAGEASVYAGTCRTLDPASANERATELRKQGRSPSLRLEVPSTSVSFHDIFQGAQAFSLAEDCGDFVLRRSDGGYAYHLATVVDDAEQGVDLVVRGADLLSSTPQQMHLAKVLGLEVPAYAHVPVILSGDGRRLAKRDHDAGLESLLDAFSTPEGVLGHIAHVCHLVDTPEPRSMEDILRDANLNALCGTLSTSWR